MKKKVVTLAHGNGGAENQNLIKNLFWRQLGNETLLKGEDAAILQNAKIAFTTDSFTVTPIFFPGGDIGKLSVCGTCNDLAMMGAKPLYLSLSIIVEEGFEHRSMEKIVASIKRELSLNGAKIVTGDTKVVPKGSVDKIFINTSGIGEVVAKGIGIGEIREGDTIVVSRDIGRHGAAIFTAREGIELESGLTSDCASLWPVVEKLLENGVTPHAMRDATRGGVAAVLNEWSEANGVPIEIEERLLPVSEEVEGVCEILGFEATMLANEGCFLMALDPADTQKALDILKSFKSCENAACIGEVSGEYKGKVVLKSEWGTKRFLDLPTGELLPRIC